MTIFLTSFLIFILFPLLKWKSAAANFCSTVVTACWLSHLGVQWIAPRCERDFMEWIEQLRLFRLEKRWIGVRYNILAFHKIKSELQKMRREHFFIVLSTGETGGHHTELWDGTLRWCKWIQKSVVSLYPDLLLLLCF